MDMIEEILEHMLSKLVYFEYIDGNPYSCTISELKNIQNVKIIYDKERYYMHMFMSDNNQTIKKIGSMVFESDMKKEIRTIYGSKEEMLLHYEALEDYEFCQKIKNMK